MSDYSDRIMAERARRGIRHTPGDPGPQPTRNAVKPQRKTQVEAHAGYDCIYRGAAIDTATCRSCNRIQQLNVHQCSVYGQCTINKLPDQPTYKDDDGVLRSRALCRTCTKKHAPTDSIEYSTEPVNGQPDANDPWVVGITTAPRHDDTNLLGVTVSSLYQAGFNNLTVFADPNSPTEHPNVVQRVDNPTRRGAFGNYVDCLRHLVDTYPSDTILMCQDDIILSPGTRQWLDENLWPDGDYPIGVVSLYTSASYSRPWSGWQNREGWRWGALAMVWRRDMAIDFLESKACTRHMGMHGIDNRIGLWLRNSKRRAYFMTPSLVQHIGDRSAVWSAKQRASGARKSIVFAGDADLSLLNFSNKAVEAKDSPPPGEATERGVTLITPTGDRHEAFRLCEKWIHRQEFAGRIQWIVVDDGKEPTRCTLGQQYVRRDPSKDTLPSLNHNLIAAMEHIAYHKVLIIEDDDWYGPHYVQTMSDMLDEHDMVGETRGRYWNVEQKAWCRLNCVQHTSLCRTGFTDMAYPAFSEACHRNTPYIDKQIWTLFNGSKNIVSDMPLAQSCVSIKGMAGRRGYTWDKKDHHRWNADPEGAVLRDWIGRDADVYLGTNVPTVGVYTVRFGDMPDPVHPAVLYPGVPYICVSDEPGKLSSWEVVVARGAQESAEQDAEQFRMLFHASLSMLDWSIYVPPDVKPPNDPITFVRDIDGDELELPDGTLARRSTSKVWLKYEQMWNEQCLTG